MMQMHEIITNASAAARYLEATGQQRWADAIRQLCAEVVQRSGGKPVAHNEPRIPDHTRHDVPAPPERRNP